MGDESQVYMVDNSQILEISASFIMPVQTQEEVARSRFDQMYVVFFATDPTTGVYIEEGRSKYYTEPPRPQFQLQYFFNLKQKLKFQLYVNKECKSPWGKFKNTYLLSTGEVVLGELLRCGQDWLRRRVTGASGYGLNLKVTEGAEEKERSMFEIEAHLLDLESTPANPVRLFCIFERQNVGDGIVEEMCRTEVVSGTIDPVWKPVLIPSKHFFNDDSDDKWGLKVTVAKLDTPKRLGNKIARRIKKEEIVLIGDTSRIEYTTIRDLDGEKKTISLRAPPEMNSAINIGKIQLSMTVKSPPTFLEYIDQGLEMNFVVAIDFTTTNGDPADPSSLHHTGNLDSNEYACAIRSVGNVIQEYDSDKKFPVFGFGARLHTGEVSHDFICNGKDDEPVVDGIEGIIEAYKKTMQLVELAGPTHIAPVIKKVKRLAELTKEADRFFVLMILTSGQVADLEEATRTIVEAAVLPISIVIVGIGTHDFTELQELGSKGKLLNIDGKYCARDIVHFASYKNTTEMEEDEQENAATVFAANVMLEIPGHVVMYKELLNQQKITRWTRAGPVRPIGLPKLPSESKDKGKKANKKVKEEEEEEENEAEGGEEAEDNAEGGGEGDEAEQGEEGGDEAEQGEEGGDEAEQGEEGGDEAEQGEEGGDEAEQGEAEQGEEGGDEAEQGEEGGDEAEQGEEGGDEAEQGEAEQGEEGGDEAEQGEEGGDEAEQGEEGGDEAEKGEEGGDEEPEEVTEEAMVEEEAVVEETSMNRYRRKSVDLPQSAGSKLAKIMRETGKAQLVVELMGRTEDAKSFSQQGTPAGNRGVSFQNTDKTSPGSKLARIMRETGKAQHVIDMMSRTTNTKSFSQHGEHTERELMSFEDTDTPSPGSKLARIMRETGKAQHVLNLISRTTNTKSFSQQRAHEGHVSFEGTNQPTGGSKLARIMQATGRSQAVEESMDRTANVQTFSQKKSPSGKGHKPADKEHTSPDKGHKPAAKGHTHADKEYTFADKGYTSSDLFGKPKNASYELWDL